MFSSGKQEIYKQDMSIEHWNSRLKSKVCHKPKIVKPYEYYQEKRWEQDSSQVLLQ